MSPASTPTPLPPDVLLPEPSAAVDPFPARPCFFLVPGDGDFPVPRASRELHVHHRLDDLIAAAARREGAVALLSPAALREEDYAQARLLRDLPGSPAVVVMGDEGKPAAAFEAARRLGTGSLIGRDEAASPELLARWIEWIGGRGFSTGLEPMLGPGARSRRRSVETKEDRRAVIEEAVAAAARDWPGDEPRFDFRMILEELVNNAILHAFVELEGMEKHVMKDFRRLDPDEAIVVEHGAAPGWIAASVSDNRGRLRREVVFDRIERQLTAAGVNDLSGRGLHLAYSLADGLVIDVSPRRATRVTALFRRGSAARRPPGSFRPLLYRTGR